MLGRERAWFSRCSTFLVSFAAMFHRKSGNLIRIYTTSYQNLTDWHNWTMIGWILIRSHDIFTDVFVNKFISRIFFFVYEKRFFSPLWCEHSSNRAKHKRKSKGEPLSRHFSSSLRITFYALAFSFRSSLDGKLSCDKGRSFRGGCEYLNENWFFWILLWKVLIHKIFSD